MNTSTGSAVLKKSMLNLRFYPKLGRTCKMYLFAWNQCLFLLGEIGVFYSLNSDETPRMSCVIIQIKALSTLATACTSFHFVLS